MPELTCILCPLGCRITVTEGTKTDDWIFEGNSCLRGAKYAKEEVTAPQRVLTAVARVENRPLMLPVKSEKPLPKEKLFLAMREVRQLTVKPPVKIGDVLKTDLAGTGVDLVATKNYR